MHKIAIPLLLLTGCGPSHEERLFRDLTDDLQALSEVLETVVDAASAHLASPRIIEIGTRLDEFMAEDQDALDPQHLIDVFNDQRLIRRLDLLAQALVAHQDRIEANDELRRGLDPAAQTVLFDQALPAGPR